MGKSLLNIIQEEYYHLLKEYMKGDEVDWDLWEKRDEFKNSIFSDFLFNNNPDYTKHIPWRLIQYPMLKKVWEDYMRYGFLRNTKALDKIEGIMIANTLKIDILTELAGHTSVNPDEDFNEWFKPLIEEYIRWKLQQKNPPDKNQLEIDYEKGGGAGKQPNVQTINPTPQEMKVFNFLDSQLDDYWNNLEAGTIDLEDIENRAGDLLEERFYDYYMEDPNSNQAYISDYGLEPLAKLVEKLRSIPEDQIGERIITLDKMLNVVHQRSDLASWFVKGGSEALSDLSASPSEKAGQKQQNEGVGDKYAQKRFGISDPEDEFEKKYQQHQKTQTQEDQNGELVGRITYGNDNYGNIYKNPRSLNNFEPNVRAVSDSDGNVYVAQLDYPGYHSTITDNIDKNIGEAYNDWKNITWHRIGNSNMFGFSISFMEYYKMQLDDLEDKKTMAERLKKVNSVNPSLVFVPIYWQDIISGEVPKETINKYAKAFGKAGKVMNETPFSKTLNEIILSEIGEATARPYSWNLIDEPDAENDEYEYTFETDSDLYYVDIETEDRNEWEVIYKTDTGDYRTVTNKGNVLRVMATIIDILKDFIERENPRKIIIQPSKTTEDDERRLKMYMAYIEKLLPVNYRINLYSNIIDQEVIELIRT